MRNVLSALIMVPALILVAMLAYGAPQSPVDWNPPQPITSHPLTAIGSTDMAGSPTLSRALHTGSPMPLLSPLTVKRAPLVGSGDQSLFSPALNYRLRPEYGQVRLTAGFRPDPHVVSVVGGGRDSTGHLRGRDCIGYTTDGPTYRLEWTRSSRDTLRIFFEPRDARLDAVILVNLPDGSWLCNDNASPGNRNPMVVIQNPRRGQYDIWVAGKRADQRMPGRLTITERNLRPGSVDAEEGWGFRMAPSHGEVRLRAGFRPDPHRVRVVAGGGLDSSVLLERCVGFVDRRPHFRLHWTGRSQQLRFYFLSNCGGDTTLLVNLPDRTWRCNDDAFPGTVHPKVSINSPQTGQYDIWVGTFSPGRRMEGTLFITERDLGPR